MVAENYVPSVEIRYSSAIAISLAADRFQPENAPYMPKAVIYDA
jgi:hypothetical protein